MKLLIPAPWGGGGALLQWVVCDQCNGLCVINAMGGVCK